MSMTETIGAKVERKHGLDGAIDALSEMPANELRSLLMTVMGRRSRRRSPADFLRQRHRDTTVASAPGDLASVVDVELRAIRAAHGFEPVILSPLTPLGLNHILGEIDQNRIATTIRIGLPATRACTDASLSHALQRSRGRW